MNNYVRKFFRAMFQSQQTQQVVRIQPQHLPTSTEEWRQHWQSQGQPWRTELEIDAKRQEDLNRHRATIPDIEKGIYPFKGMKLSRADVEWLLTTHESGGMRGLVDWNNESQRQREGVDLRGANLRQENLSALPLTRMRGGLTFYERVLYTEEQQSVAAVHLEGAHLEGAQLQGAILLRAQLQGANLLGARLQQAILLGALLQDAQLQDAQLQEAFLEDAQLQGADLRRTDLKHATLDQVTFSDQTYGSARFADINWGEVNLTVIGWGHVTRLGDEQVAHQEKRSRTRENFYDSPSNWINWSEGEVKSRIVRLNEYKEAVRANRQLTVVLREQGLDEDANRFAYRAQILQRKLLWKQRNFWKWLGSAVLALLAGYGYRMWHILAAYLLIVLLCAGAYFVLGMYYEPHLSLLEAVLTSVTAFHGRVFSEPFLRPGEPQLWVTAFEAVSGLVIEGVFIAMLTQKFFGK
jgi:uncharacterized protein YjbI with pentapeptide repeats